MLVRILLQRDRLLFPLLFAPKKRIANCRNKVVKKEEKKQNLRCDFIGKKTPLKGILSVALVQTVHEHTYTERELNAKLKRHRITQL